MNYKKYLSGVLAAAMVLNTGAVSVLAAGTDTSVQEASQTQTSSTPETVYVNSYDGKERSVPANQRLASVAVHVPAHPLIQGKERDPEEYPPPRHAYDRAYRSLHDRLSLPGGCPYVSFRRMVG